MKLIKVIFIFFIFPNVANALTSWTTGKYENNQNISKVLLIPGAKKIEVSISGDTEECCDHVYIYNAQIQTDNPVAIETLSGVINKTFVVNSRSIKVKLVSDYSVTGKGISVTIKKVGDNKEMEITDIPDAMGLKGWYQAEKLMRYWFQGSGETMKVSIDDIQKMNAEIRDTIDNWEVEAFHDRILDEDLKKYLIVSLKKLSNGKGGSVIPDGGTFDFIDSELKKAGNSYHEQTWEKENLDYIRDVAIEGDLDNINDYVASYSAISLRLVAKGKVEIDDEIATINIDKFGVYLRDKYDFEDEYDFWSQILGCWSKKPPYFSRNDVFGDAICVDNEDFVDYNLKFGHSEEYRNYLIFTDPKNRTFYGYSHFEYNIAKPDNNSTTLKYIDKCINKFKDFFGEKKGSTETCYDNNYNKYYCQSTTGSGNLIAISQELDTLKFYYRSSKGWGNLSLNMCK